MRVVFSVCVFVAGCLLTPDGLTVADDSATTAELEVTIDREKSIGASFIEAERVSHVDVQHNIVYAKPGKKALKYDVYRPQDAQGLPIVVITHGGGWKPNDEVKATFAKHGVPYAAKMRSFFEQHLGKE